MDKEQLIKLVAKHVNVPGLVKDVLDEVVETALDKVVADSANPYDDMIKATLYPVLEAEVNNLVTKKWAELIA